MTELVNKKGPSNRKSVSSSFTYNLHTIVDREWRWQDVPRPTLLPIPFAGRHALVKAHVTISHTTLP